MTHIMETTHIRLTSLRNFDNFIIVLFLSIRCLEISKQKASRYTSSGKRIFAIKNVSDGFKYI